MYKLVTTLNLLLLLISVAGAQTKSETKLYKTTLSKGDLKSFNKFLGKYPASPYSNEITRKRDSIHFFALPPNDAAAYETFIKNYPHSGFAERAAAVLEELNQPVLTHSQAMEVFRETLHTGYTPLAVAGYKQAGTEYIAGVIPPSRTDSGHYRIVILRHNGKGDLQETASWSISQEKKEQRYTQESRLETFNPVTDPAETRIIPLDGGKYLQFNYYNEGKKSPSAEFISNLYSLQDNTVYSVMYSGKKEKENGTGFMEGSSMDAPQGGAFSTPQMAYLLKYQARQNFLKPISKEKALTDTAIEWWYNENKPGAQTLSFGILPPDNPIVKGFTGTKEKEKGKQWDIALFDIRGNTVVVAFDKARRQYALVWCEPAAANTRTDKFLNNIYFEKEPVIVLFYYQGNTTSKKRINLASKSIR